MPSVPLRFSAMALPQASSRLFFGWRVVGAAFVFAVFAWGLCFYGPSVFLHEIHRTHGWPVSLVSAAITTLYLLGAGFIAFLDDAHRRFGLVATTRCGTVALSLGILGWGVAAAPWQLFVAAGLTALGWSATSGAAINAMLVPWFRRRRGAALSLAFNGASFGGLLFTPLWIALIARFGFPAAASLIAAATLVILWLLAGRYLRPTPAALGLAPDGEPPASAAREFPAPKPRPPIDRAVLLRQRRFLTISGAFTCGLFAQVGLVAHLVSLLVPALGEAGAAAAMSLTTLCAIIGRLLLGALVDRTDRRAVAAANFAIQACGFALLLLGGGAATLLAGCVLFGFGLGNLISLPPLIAEREFDAADLGRVVALIIAINQAVFSFAPGVFGALRDLTDGYAAPLALAIGLHRAAAGVVLLGRRWR
jgi:MFS family permease